MSIASTSVNGVRIYNLSAGKTLPEWLMSKSKEKLRTDKEFRSHIELIQGFDFPTASQKIRETPNGKYCLATGTYPPQIRCYEYSQLSIKWKRHLDCEVVQFVSLADDWTKLVLLGNDRHIEFHTQGGTYFKTRIPKFGRDIAYDDLSCDLYVVASGSEIYRLNLEQGRFLSPLSEPLAEEGLNVIHVGTANGLVATGGDAGIVQCWDRRMRHLAGSSDVRARITDSTFGADPHASITALKFDENNWLSMAVGTDTGHIALYDLRMERPHRLKDHQNSAPICSVKYLDEDRIMSADTQGVKFWDKNTGGTFTTVETGNDVNDACVVRGTGLLYVAGEQQRTGTFFIPQLGTAPTWCTFLENLTEELEDAPITVYDDFKFMTKEELVQIGLDHLIGSSMLRAYMHGYFVDIRLYHKAKSITDPFAFESYKKKLVSERVERDRETRISLKRRVPKAKVNRALAEKLSRSDKNKKGESALLGDERFKGLFTNPAYQVDENNDDYQRLHAGGGGGKPIADAREEDTDDEMLSGIFEQVDVERDDSSTSTSDEEQAIHVEKPKPRHKKMFKMARGVDYDWSKKQDERKAEHRVPLGRRAEKTSVIPITRGPIHTLSFTPKKRRAVSDRAIAEMTHNAETRSRDRRGVKTLKLPGDRGRGRGRGRGR